jgi:hypothetical protein
VARFAEQVFRSFNVLVQVAGLGRKDVWLTIWCTFPGELNRRERLGSNETLIDGGFEAVKKGAGGRQNQVWQRHKVDGTGKR